MKTSKISCSKNKSRTKVRRERDIDHAHLSANLVKPERKSVTSADVTTVAKNHQAPTNAKSRSGKWNFCSVI